MKSLLRDGGYASGRVIQFSRSPDIVRMVASTGYDFVWIDTRHSSLTLDTIADMCTVARACGITPIVRPYSHDPLLAHRLLDIGAMGLVFIDVTTRAQIEGFRDAMLYAPSGSRSGFTGAATDHCSPVHAATSEAMNASTLLGIQIDSKEGLESLDSILKGGGVDLVKVSHLDSLLGLHRDLNSAAYTSALDRVVETSTRHGATVAAFVSSNEEVPVLMRHGVRCIYYPNDYSVLMDIYRRDSAAFRAQVAERQVVDG